MKMVRVSPLITTTEKVANNMFNQSRANNCHPTMIIQHQVWKQSLSCHIYNNLSKNLDMKILCTIFYIHFCQLRSFFRVSSWVLKGYWQRISSGTVMHISEYCQPGHRSLHHIEEREFLPSIMFISMNISTFIQVLSLESCHVCIPFILWTNGSSSYESSKLRNFMMK